MFGKYYENYFFFTALSVILVFAICISVMLYKEWQISRRTDIESTTIILQEGVVPNDLSEILESADIWQIYCNGAKSYEYYR